jgi:cholesterol transport system auxiliary component
MRRRWLLGGMVGTALATALGGGGCSVLPSQPYLQRRDWPLVVRRAGDSAAALPPVSGPPVSGPPVSGPPVSGPPESGPAVSRSPGRGGGLVLLVRTVQVGPGLETRGLQTLQQDGSLKSDFYEQWAVPPAEAIDDDLRRWLADSGLFAAVVGPGSRMTADLVLEGELLALYADLASMTARAALALVLIDERPGPARIGPGRIGLEQTAAASVKLEGTDPPALARAQLAAVAAMLRETEADLASALHR